MAKANTDVRRKKQAFLKALVKAGVLDSKASISEHNGEADEERDGLVRWARKMTEVVDSPVDVYAEFTIER